MPFASQGLKEQQLILIAILFVALHWQLLRTNHVIYFFKALRWI
jgi:hypothetical protein